MSTSPARPIIDTPLGQYEWIENWIEIPRSPWGDKNGRTHGVVVTRDGRIVVFHQADPAVLIYSPEGELLNRWGNYPGAHGMHVVEEDGVEYLWLTDQDTEAVHKTTLDGEVVLSLERPPHPAYAETTYQPTWADEFQKSKGGNGDIWVVDGYGAFLAHRYDASGTYLETLDGSAGAGTFKVPHGCWVDYRKADPELYIADRGNCRVQVFDLEGKFKRELGNDFMIKPDGFSAQGEIMVVPDLKARLTLCDIDDQLICHIGQHDDAPELPGWPEVNRRQLLPGRFNSPHGAVMDAAGNIFVVEWILGGRVTKLAKLK